ncbi:MAG: non-ribosomal peptide synthetase, partial [Chloroflexota bacterium]
MTTQDLKVPIPKPKNFSPVPPEAIRQSVADRFETVVERYPDNIAISEDKQQITYRELNESANRLANSILSRVEEGDRSPIPFLAGYGISSIVTLLAIMKTGHPYVPLNPTFPVERNNLLLADMGAKLLVSDSQYSSKVAHFQDAQSTLDVLYLDSLDPSASPENPGIVLSPKDLLNISYTSGSTGNPKGGVSNQLYWTYQISFRVNEWYITPEDRIPLLSNFSFGASLGPILSAFFSGARVCLFDFSSENLIDTIDWLHKIKATIFRSTPSTFRTIFGEVPESTKFEHLRMIGLAGGPVSKRDVALYRAHTRESCILSHQLASTEAGYLTRYRIDHSTPVDEEILPVGYPIEGKQVRLLDDDGNQVAQGEVGEIVVTSRFLRSGYWNRPALTDEIFRPDPNDAESRILYTSDLGRLRADGALEFFGRKDNMVKIRGFRVETVEVESFLYKHSAVKQVAVIGQPLPHAPENKQLVAFMVPHQDQEVNGKELRLFLAEKVPDYMIPSRFAFLDALPLNPNGKIDYQALIKFEIKRPDLSNQYVEPENDLEIRLKSIWEDLLGISSIGVLDNFFELGADSLLARRLFLRIEEVFGRKFPLSILVEASNIRQQAEILSTEDFQPNWSPLVPVQPDGDQTPVFCLAGKGGNPLRFRLLA